MLQAKTFEVRDAATFIPCFGVLCEPVVDGSPADATPADSYLLLRAGYGHPRPDKAGRCVIFTRLDGHASNIAPYDPVDWLRNRTMLVAHEYVWKNWDSLESGAVIDVEFILGLSAAPKTSERTTIPIPYFPEKRRD